MKHPKHLIKKLRRNKPPVEDPNVPRITNDTVAEHREAVLSSARKYIYPLQHSKHRVVVISIILLIVAVIGFFTACTLALYRFQSESAFLYDVTKVVPFPVAKAGNRYVAYENYLFELRRYKHYYENQQKLDFDSTSGKTQLAAYKKQAMQQVVDAAYVKELAAKHKVSVSNQEVDAEVTTLRAQNRLGSSDQVFRDVLREYWGWSVADFKRELKTQLLAQKVAAKLDTETQARANAALEEVKKGIDFAEVAKKYSDDEATKNNGGQYGQAIEKSSQELPAQLINGLFKLKPGQVSEVIQTDNSFVIVKQIDNVDNKVHAAVIVCNIKSINTYLDPLKKTSKTSNYITL